MTKKLAQKLAINLIRITELNPSDDCEAIEWILATSLPIETIDEAMTVAEYVYNVGRLERFHFILKSGLGAERI